MKTTNLTRASRELFRRTPDECFGSLTDLRRHCEEHRDSSQDRWYLPQEVVLTSEMTLCAGKDGAELGLNDWSFSQLCRMAGVAKETINRLSHKTASRALQETFPQSEKPLQILTTADMVRSVHGVAYTRLWNADLLDVVAEFGSDFQPPQRGMTGGTGLYCGEQDLFCFLIDPQGWTDIGGEAFAPGLFLWNSEVGRRSVGIQTFWFQRICCNHIVWDAVNVVDFKRKHTANVRDGLDEIRRIIAQLIERRDARKDGFVRAIENAMHTRLGEDTEEVAKVLAKHGIGRQLTQEAIKTAAEQGQFTIFAIVDALTRLTQRVRYAGDRTELDQKVAALLALAA
jgi:hypothetical protein